MMRARTISLCTLLLFSLASPALANSGPTTGAGNTASGALAVEENSPVRVLAEELTFDLRELEGGYYLPEGQVTARYTMENPTAEHLNVPMVFPYIGYLRHFTRGQIGVRVDGEPVAYTALSANLLGYDGTELSFAQMLARLDPSPYTPLTLDPGQTVTLHRFTLEATASGEEYELVLSYEVGPDTSILPYAGWNGFKQLEDGQLLTVRSWLEPVEAYLLTTEELELDIRVADRGLNPFEADSLAQLDELLEAEGDAAHAYVHTRLDVPLSEAVADIVGTITDRYDIQVTPELRDRLCAMTLEDLDRFAAAGGGLFYDGSLTVLQLITSGSALLGLYYEVEFPPGAVVEMEVTCPIQGAFDFNHWNYDYYTFTYLLSPAGHWADFGDLTVTVLTHPDMAGLSPGEGGDAADLPFARAGDGSYTAQSRGLPEGELVFTLYTDNRSISRPLISLYVLLAGILLLILFRAVRRRRRKKRRI